MFKPLAKKKSTPLSENVQDLVQLALLNCRKHYAKETEGKGDGLAKHVSRPKPCWSSVGHPQTEGGGAQGL